MAIVINPISPVAFSILGIDIRWYALAYIAGFIAGYILFRRLMRDTDSRVKLDARGLDDLLTAIVFGVILGGRIGYVLFYNLGFFIENPWEIFADWHGVMSFHGGLIGVIIATCVFAWRRKISALAILDLLAVVVPIGLFFGRIANFINREVMGRPTDMPWGIVFNGDVAIPRHPSPLYEATAEGIVLFAVMYGLYRCTNLRMRPGALGGIMAMAYALLRTFCEMFRAPDVQIGFLTSWGLTMGQLLSAIMFCVGATIFTIAIWKKYV